MNPLPNRLKETAMLYKTITLELIQDRPELHEQLRRSGTLLATMESLAAQLKASYEAWKDHLARAEPNLDLRDENLGLDLEVHDTLDLAGIKPPGHIKAKPVFRKPAQPFDRWRPEQRTRGAAAGALLE